MTEKNEPLTVNQLSGMLQALINAGCAECTLSCNEYTIYGVEFNDGNVVDLVGDYVTNSVTEYTIVKHDCKLCVGDVANLLHDLADRTKFNLRKE